MLVAKKIEFVIAEDPMADKGRWRLERFSLNCGNGEPHFVGKWWGSARPIDIAATFGLLRARAERNPDEAAWVGTDDQMRDQAEGLLGWMKQLNRTAIRPNGNRPHTASFMFYPLLGKGAQPEFVAEKKIKLFELFVQPDRNVGYRIREGQFPLNWRILDTAGSEFSLPQIEQFVADMTGAASTAPPPFELRSVTLAITEQRGRFYGSIVTAIGGKPATPIMLDGEKEEAVARILQPALEASGIYRLVFVEAVSPGSLLVSVSLTESEEQKLSSALDAGKLAGFGIEAVTSDRSGAQGVSPEVAASAHDLPISMNDFGGFFAELKTMARGLLAREKGADSIRPTALVISAIRRNKLSGQDWSEISWKNRRYFFGSMRRAMNRSLIDHYRMKTSASRPKLVYLPPEDIDFSNLQSMMLDHPERIGLLTDSLTWLEEEHPKEFEVVELRFYVGLTVDETAEFLERSVSWVKDRWRTARLRLARKIDEFQNQDRDA